MLPMQQVKQTAQTSKGERIIKTAKVTSASLATGATLSLIAAVTDTAAGANGVTRGLLIVGLKLNFVDADLDTAAWQLGGYDGSTFTALCESVYSWEGPQALCLVPAGSSFRLKNTGVSATVTNISATILYCEV